MFGIDRLEPRVRPSTPVSTFLFALIDLSNLVDLIDLMDLVDLIDLIKHSRNLRLKIEMHQYKYKGNIKLRKPFK
jgi:hypothetical protein